MWNFQDEEQTKLLRSNRVKSRFLQLHWAGSLEKTPCRGDKAVTHMEWNRPVLIITRAHIWGGNTPIAQKPSSRGREDSILSGVFILPLYNCAYETGDSLCLRNDLMALDDHKTKDKLHPWLLSVLRNWSRPASNFLISSSLMPPDITRWVLPRLNNTQRRSRLFDKGN